MIMRIVRMSRGYQCFAQGGKPFLAPLRRVR